MANRVHDVAERTHTHRPLISHKPGFNTHFSIPLSLCCRKSLLTEDALKSIGIWLPQPFITFQHRSLCLLYANTWSVLVWMGEWEWEYNSCPQDSILNGPVSWEVLLRQASTCQAARLSTAELDQTLKEKLGRYRRISFHRGCWLLYHSLLASPLSSLDFPHSCSHTSQKICTIHFTV